MAGYLTFVARRTGTLTGWLDIQRLGWHTRTDGGVAVAKFIAAQLAGPRSLMEAATVAVVLGIPILVWAAARIRLPWPLMLYSLAVVVMTLTTAGIMNSKIRMLLPGLPLLLPFAISLAKLRGSTPIAAVIIATLVSAGFGAYCLLIYSHAI